jgi:hypothetical protein
MTKENYGNVSNEDDLKWKMNSKGRLPKISKLKYLHNDWPDPVGSSSNRKHKLI